MKLNSTISTKLLALLVLLLLCLLFALSSSIIYGLEAAQSGINQAEVVFSKGNDWPPGSVLESDLKRISLALIAYPNATLTYEQPLNISNVDSSSHQLTIRNVLITPVSGEPEVGNFSFINFVILNENGKALASFNYTTTDNVWSIPQSRTNLTLLPGAQWIIEVETRAAPGASCEIVARIQIGIDIQ